MKIFMIISAILIILGLIICIAALASCGFDLGKSEKQTTEEFTIPKNIVNVDINTKGINSDVIIKKGTAENASLTLTHSEKIKLSYSVSDSVLKIESENNMRWYDHIFNHAKTRITLTLPEQDYENFTFNGTSGDISISDLNLKSLSIDNTSGDLTLKNLIVTENATVKTTSGDAEIDDIVAKSLEIKITTGDIEIKDAKLDETLKISTTTGELDAEEIECASLSLATTTGEIDLTDINVSGNATLESKSGSIEAVNARILGKLSVDITSGDVELLDSDASEIYIETTTGDVTASLLSKKNFKTEVTTGEMKVPDSDYNYGICEIKTTTGDILVTIVD